MVIAQVGRDEEEALFRHSCAKAGFECVPYSRGNSRGVHRPDEDVAPHKNPRSDFPSELARDLLSDLIDTGPATVDFFELSAISEALVGFLLDKDTGDEHRTQKTKHFLLVLCCNKVKRFPRNGSLNRGGREEGRGGGVRGIP